MPTATGIAERATMSKSCESLASGLAEPVDALDGRMLSANSAPT